MRKRKTKKERERKPNLIKFLDQMDTRREQSIKVIIFSLSPSVSCLHLLPLSNFFFPSLSLSLSLTFSSPTFLDTPSSNMEDIGVVFVGMIEQKGEEINERESLWGEGKWWDKNTY